ncbi:hypothetical protein VZT92_024185 [Zoarces viviparus]|uniref:Uncharacterized protein n=1 Tax=Zoarces viviparus TaxID=48416 RepID=A0AAW1E1V6_ZOAVI
MRSEQGQSWRRSHTKSCQPPPTPLILPPMPHSPMFLIPLRPDSQRNQHSVAPSIPSAPADGQLPTGLVRGCGVLQDLRAANAT